MREINFNRERFHTTHHERDKETGLDYRGARFYDSDIGRFLSLDPLADEFFEWSAFSYTLDNPVFYTDPTGAAPDPPKWVSNAWNWVSDQASASWSWLKGQSAASRHIRAHAQDINYSGDPALHSGTGGVGEVFIGHSNDALETEALTQATILVPEILNVAMGGSTRLPKAKGYKGVGAVGLGDDAVEVTIDAAKYPESARHAQEAIESGVNNTGVIDRAGAAARRRSNLKGMETKPGLDRDEFPPAMLNSGKNVSKKHINSSDNRGSGSSIGHQLRGYPDGTKVKVIPTKVKHI